MLKIDATLSQKNILTPLSKFDKKASEQPKTFDNDLLSTQEKRSHLGNFILLVSFYTPLKQKTSGFFLGGIERDHRHKMKTLKQRCLTHGSLIAEIK